MNLRLISLTVATAFALAPVGAAAADGNVAENSVGTAQVSSISTAPTVQASNQTTDVAATAPASIDGAGGNQASGAVGTVQAGGGNTATGSLGSAQVSASTAAPAANVTSGST